AVHGRYEADLALAYLHSVQRRVHHGEWKPVEYGLDRKSTRLNSSHSQISYAVFCLKKKKNMTDRCRRIANIACSVGTQLTLLLRLLELPVNTILPLSQIRTFPSPSLFSINCSDLPH